jgi:ABC-type sugar transport system permease subunit
MRLPALIILVIFITLPMAYATTPSLTSYVKLSKKESLAGKHFTLKKDFTNNLGKTEQLIMIFDMEASGLWSCSLAIAGARELRIVINGHESYSSMVFLKFNSNGSLAFITDAAGERISSGKARMVLTYRPSSSQKRMAVYIDFGTIGALTNSSLQLD